MGNGSLFYTYKIGLGQSFISTFAYYLASPLNLLLLFFNNIESAIKFIITLKIGLCGLTMFIYLKNSFKEENTKLLIFSTTYALSLQLLANYFNILWLDSYYLAPLVLLGIDKLIDKNNSILYFITLFLTISINYYMGYMVCLFSIMYFIIKLYLKYDKLNKDALRLLKKFLIVSILSGMCSMFINIPNLLQMSNIDRKSISLIYENPVFNLNILKSISKLYMSNHTYDDLLNRNFVYLYFGMFPLLNLILYFFNKNITKKEKKVMLFLISILFISIVINPINNIWHGFSNPLGFNYRYYYLFLIMFIYASCKNFINLYDVNVKKIIIIFIVFLLISILCILTNNMSIKSFIFSNLLIIIYCILLYYSNTHEKSILIILLCLTFMELYSNGSNLFNDFELDKNIYTEYRTIIKSSTLNKIQDDDKFYRIEFSNSEVNDSILYNYNSSSSWYSTINSTSTHFLSRFGYAIGINEYSHVELPILDSILNIKYNINIKEKIDGILSLDEIINNNVIVKNPYNLNLGFMISNSSLEDFDCENPYECQNVLATQLTGTDIKYYKEENIIKNDNKYTFTINNTNNFVIRFPYKYTTNDSFSYDVYINGSYMQTITQDTGFVSEFTNNAKIGTKIEISIENIVGNIKADEIFVYYKNEEELQKMYDILSKNQLDITSLKDGYIKGTVESTEDKNILFLSIPYEKGWYAKVDGKKIEINSLYDTFISLELSKGVHNVELYYITPGLKLGILISSISLFGYLVYLYFEKKQNKKTIN